MTGETILYYIEILKRVRKGKPPIEDADVCQELLAFDFVYALSLLYARRHSGISDLDLELVWSDEMLLDCGKLAGLLAHEMGADEDWNELRCVFEPYVSKRIEEYSDEVESSDLEAYDPPVGGFAFSEYVRFKEMLECLLKYRRAKQTVSHEKLVQTMERILLGNPKVNGGNSDTSI